MSTLININKGSVSIVGALSNCGFLLRENGGVILRENGGNLTKEESDCDLVNINKNNATLTSINKN